MTNASVKIQNLKLWVVTSAAENQNMVLTNRHAKYLKDDGVS